MVDTGEPSIALGAVVWLKRPLGVDGVVIEIVRPARLPGCVIRGGASTHFETRFVIASEDATRIRRAKQMVVLWP